MFFFLSPLSRLQFPIFLHILTSGSCPRALESSSIRAKTRRVKLKLILWARLEVKPYFQLTSRTQVYCYSSSARLVWAPRWHRWCCGTNGEIPFSTFYLSNIRVNQFSQMHWQKIHVICIACAWEGNITSKNSYNARAKFQSTIPTFNYFNLKISL